MRVNEEISSAEYAIKKDELLKEKQKYEQLIADTNQRIETWLDRAENLFSFAQTARQRFEVGSLEDKRNILSCLGSNLLLTDKILNIHVDKNLAILKNLAPEVQDLHNRLEPTQSKAPQRFWEAHYTSDCPS